MADALPRENEAHPESRLRERQPAFSIETPRTESGTRSAPSLEANPGSLPEDYPRNRLWSVFRDAHSLYCYWQLALPVDRFPGARLAITVHRSDGTHESTAFPSRSSGTRFIDVSSSGTLYHLTLGFLPPGKTSRKDMLFVIAQQSVRTPRDYPLPGVGAHSGSRGLLSSRGGHSPEVLALLFPDLAKDTFPSGSPSSAHPPRHPQPRRPVLPPERGGFLPPNS